MIYLTNTYSKDKTNTKTKPLTCRIKDMVSSHLANRIHLDPVEIQGLLRFKKICPSAPIPGADQEPYLEY